MRPPPAVHASAFGGPFGGGSLFSSIGPSSAAHFGASHFSFGAPVPMAPRPPPPPRK